MFVYNYNNYNYNYIKNGVWLRYWSNVDYTDAPQDLELKELGAIHIAEESDSPTLPRNPYFDAGSTLACFNSVRVERIWASVVGETSAFIASDCIGTSERHSNRSNHNKDQFRIHFVSYDNRLQYYNQGYT